METHTTSLISSLQSGMNSINQLILQLLPQRCLLCQQPCDNSKPLCQCCQSDIPRFDYQSLNHLLLRPDIRRGLKKPQFDTLVSLAPYCWPYDQWINALKFKSAFNLAHLMAKLMLEKISQLRDQQRITMPQVIFPMPIHPWRRLSRGYNQAHLLSKPLAKTLNIELNTRALKRIRHTNAQTRLDKKARLTNVKQAFNYTPQQSYRHVAIIDDVITTGATVNEACKSLKAAGVEHISVWTICATINSN